MFDEEINLNPSGPTSKATQSPSGNATSTAKALLRNQKFYCARIKAEVSPLNCKGKYTYARAQSITASPCLECAKVLAMLRKEPLANYTEPQKPIDPKELAAMARPAKKGTPDPIQQEAKTEPKLEIVATQQRETKPVASQNKADLSDKNPFAGWSKFNPRDQIRPGDVYVRIGKTSMTMSAAAADGLNLNQYDTVDVYHAAGKLGLHFQKGNGGTFVLTKETRGGKVRKMSCASLVKNLKLKELGAMDRRLPLREVAPGMIEVNLKSEVAA